MKSLRPILRDNPNERVRVLLSSARLDVPASGWKERTLLALAPVACVAPISQVTSLTPEAAATVAPKASSGVASAIAVKWAVIGAIAGGSLTASVMYAAQRQSEARPAVTAGASHQSASVAPGQPQSPSSSERAAERSAPEPTPQQAADQDDRQHPLAHNTDLPRIDTPSERSLSSTPPQSAHGRFGTGMAIGQGKARAANSQSGRLGSIDTTARGLRSDEKPSLGEEVRSLQRIRQISMERGSVAALEQLDQHERRYPVPGLGIEAAVLRIDLLWYADQKSAARSLGESFLRRHPDCPHSQHVRSLLGQK